MSTSYKFTENWFAYAEQIWPKVLNELMTERDSCDLLEIGSYEGRSTTWLIENVMRDGDRLFCVDTWRGGAEHAGINMADVEDRFDSNIDIAIQRKGLKGSAVVKDKLESSQALARYITEGKKFSFIYIDGSHAAKDVLSDAVMSWQLLSEGGIMVFDDYLWGDPNTPLTRPKLAIDFFLNINAPEINLRHIGYQVVLTKLKGNK